MKNGVACPSMMWSAPHQHAAGAALVVTEREYLISSCSRVVASAAVVILAVAEPVQSSSHWRFAHCEESRTQAVGIHVPPIFDHSQEGHLPSTAFGAY